MDRINKRFGALAEPLLKARAAFTRAKQSTQRVLEKVGFEPVEDEVSDGP
ncbi:hypothetical protein [Phyllobacterium zundukense]|uniref:Uncharacterized protein n=1 Tax=Phyllobacterium zundukense TaxID=1867719 RepID=A0ACD4CVY1_9HYPH|nr:hypothetical protein [Phyllobacterium zundukense]UXN57758.1 hypothetical protein N8E88_02810 [Phyllobacterium zundukense]